jgi:PD-(D/E)XK nuclease superfamily
MRFIYGSVVKSFQTCRLKYHWQFLQGYSPIVTAEALEFGSAFHAGMEALFDPYTWDMPLIEAYRRAKAVFVGRCEQQRQRYLSMIEAYQLDPQQEVDVTNRIELGCGMLRKVARTVDRKKYRPASVEEEAFAQVVDEKDEPLFCQCDECWKKYMAAWPGAPLLDHRYAREAWVGLPVFYGVRIDAVLVDQDGGYWIVDWKSASQLLQDPLILELDGQIASYGWALIQSLNLDFKGFHYVQIRKDVAHPPKLLLHPRLGRWYSTAKNQRTDFLIASTTFKKGDPEAYEAGLYSEYLEYLRTDGPKFIMWHTVYKTDRQLKTIGNDLYMAIADMLDNPKIYAESGFHCRFCAFQLPCLERQSGEDYQYLLDNEYEQRGLYYILERERRQKSSV